jgi:hypothetical protein
MAATSASAIQVTTRDRPDVVIPHALPAQPSTITTYLIVEFVWARVKPKSAIRGRLWYYRLGVT